MHDSVCMSAHHCKEQCGVGTGTLRMACGKKAAEVVLLLLRIATMLMITPYFPLA
jgi:hypothetical protein